MHQLDGFLCSQCSQIHDGPALAWHLRRPDAWIGLRADGREGCYLSSDQCVIDGEHFFVRGLVELPVVDGEGPFCWGVWVSLSQANFERSSELWEDPARTKEPSYFGWLCNSIPGYPPTLNLKTAVHTREVGLRPFVELEPTDHPLAVDQRVGITQMRVREIAESMLHPGER